MFDDDPDEFVAAAAMKMSSEILGLATLEE